GRSAFAAKLRTWQAEPGLASVWDASALDRLPAEERAGWEALWRDVATAIREAEGPAEAPRPEPAGRQQS
ncbi:MAG TPA: hypothetical protein VF170_09395, partial [Planctomycetaceae bacterium]